MLLTAVFLPQIAMVFCFLFFGVFFCITSSFSGFSNLCPDSAICFHSPARNLGRNEQNELLKSAWPSKKPVSNHPRSYSWLFCYIRSTQQKTLSEMPRRSHLLYLTALSEIKQQFYKKVISFRFLISIYS